MKASILVQLLTVCSTLTAAEPLSGVRPLLGRLPVGEDAKPAAPKWGAAQIVFVGTVEKVIAGPVAKSFPPIYNHTLEFSVKEVLRGTIKAGAPIRVHHSARQEIEPVFPKGQCVVALEFVRDGYNVIALKEVKIAELAEIQLLVNLPLGWKVAAGKAVSPWSELSGKVWPKDSKAGAKLACAKTGRPAWMAGESASFKVEKVAPKVAVEFTNPDGDGEYQITVGNPTEKPITLEALRTNGKNILWKESLVILCQENAYLIPGAKGIAQPSQALVLKPGESVSTIVQALALEGPQWPNGGYRIQFQFCLGEKSVVQSFYYFSRHHDGIRQGLKALQRELDVKPQS
ncbi:MAG: hypothetical protein EXS24_05470 [Pedosphaera sp.]|nr:hypothetical protein [Pedosphaera sp.]MSU40219.1 hypothetical protein [Pedosphaera sp.]